MVRPIGVSFVAVDKFSISLPEDLVAEVDGIARSEGLTRSGVIREATAAYVTARTSATYEAERKARIQSAIDGFDAMAEAWGPDPKSSLEYLRELRGDAGGPPGGAEDAEGE
ncbi:MAG: hypothetical protein C0418_03165 [Coriobacteriaceae bacterium]|nr:hypothetical protein [Coriobacteriaceae bacterium]